MCVAILSKPNSIIPEPRLAQGWKANSDGGGFAYVNEDNKVVIEKGFMEYEPFRDSYMKAAGRYAETSPMLVHLRIRTSGNTSPANCHPFHIKDGAMIHNGIMFTPTGDRAGSAHDRKSDTRVFAEALYNILKLEHVKNAAKELRSAIGYGNKLAFLYNNKEYFILGESDGYWLNDIWYSNIS